MLENPLNLVAITVNWKLPDDTIACVQSLQQAGLAPEQVIVVDNGSGADCVDRLYRELGERVNLLALPENLGFAGGNNAGIEKALAQGAEWLFLINNDAIVASTHFAELAEAVRLRPDWQLISPLIFYFDEPTRIWALGDRLIPGTLITLSLYRNQVAPANLDRLIEVDFLTGCALMVHRSVFAAIGRLDTSFFMYAEDADFCWRARQAGFKLGCCTSAQVWHKVSRSTGVHDPRSRYWRIHSQTRFYQRYARGWQRPLMLGFSLLRTLRLAITDLLAGRRVVAQSAVRGWRDGWAGMNQVR